MTFKSFYDIYYLSVRKANFPTLVETNFPREQANNILSRL